MHCDLRLVSHGDARGTALFKIYKRAHHAADQGCRELDALPRRLHILNNEHVRLWTSRNYAGPVPI